MNDFGNIASVPGSVVLLNRYNRVVSCIWQVSWEWGSSQVHSGTGQRLGVATGQQAS